MKHNSVYKGNKSKAWNFRNFTERKDGQLRLKDSQQLYGDMILGLSVERQHLLEGVFQVSEGEWTNARRPTIEIIEQLKRQGLCTLLAVDWIFVFFQNSYVET